MARAQVSYALDNLRGAAMEMELDDVINEHPEAAARVGDVGSQLWTMEELARDIERKLAAVYAVFRNGAARG